MAVSKMSWRPPYRSSKFRHVYGKPATMGHSYTGLPITRSVHDNQYCAVNPRFVAVVTECAGGGAFLIISIHQTGRVDPHHARVCGHSGRVLDVKWDPFNDKRIASCSEDCTVKVWDIPWQGVSESMTTPSKELLGHARRVALIEWHPTARDVLLSAAYDYKVCVWRLDGVSVCVKQPVCVISVHRDVILSMSLSPDGSALATTCKDKRVRVINPRTGQLLQESCCRSHRACKVLYLGDMNMLLSTGNSQWNQRQIALWDPEDLSGSLMEEDLDGGSGVLFPFYDADTHMLYLAGKGDGNIRYYEVSAEKPYVHFLAEYRSLLPQKGMGVMPKRGLDVSVCEVFRFYRLVTVKDLVAPLSLIVPRRSDSFQEDLYPMTAGTEAAMTAQEWLLGMNKGPVLMSLKPGAGVPNPYPAPEQVPGPGCSAEPLLLHPWPGPVEEEPAYHDSAFPDITDLTDWQEDETHGNGWSDTHTHTLHTHALNADIRHTHTLYTDTRHAHTLPALSPHTPSPYAHSTHTHSTHTHSQLQWNESAIYTPLKTESQLLEEIALLRQQVSERDDRVRQLELDVKNLRNHLRASF